MYDATVLVIFCQSQNTSNNQVIMKKELKVMAQSCDPRTSALGRQKEKGL